jgi:hypothetical protein
MASERRPILRPRYSNPDAIVIVEQDGETYTVRVEPPQEGFTEPQSFDRYKAARGFAGGVRLTRGYAIDDRCAP